MSLILAACSSEASSGPSDDDGCSSDNDCKGDRVCEEGACVDPDGAGGSGSGGGPVGGSGQGGDVTTPGGPEFLSFGTNVASVSGTSEDAVVTFTAVLTDPDGVDDLIGGSLLDASGAPYGAFATSGQEGAYEMTLAWSQIDAVSAIEFDKGPGTSRAFKGQFFDSAGHVAERTLTITLTCDGAPACAGQCYLARCGSECIWLGDDANCSGCGDDCGDGWCTDDLVCFGAENTNSLCSDGLDNDDDGYFDCVDYNCSMNPSVTVCD